MQIDISCDNRKLDIDFIHRFLCLESTWALGIDKATVEAAIANSLCFGAYDIDTGAQLGFARIVTDHATFAYLSDVFVAKENRGIGISKALLDAVMRHPSISQARRCMLVTSTAPGLYEKYGFQALANPGIHMEILQKDIYTRPT